MPANRYFQYLRVSNGLAETTRDTRQFNISNGPVQQEIINSEDLIISITRITRTSGYKLLDN